MPKIESQISPASAEFQANMAAMKTLVAELDARRAAAAAGGPEPARERHAAMGKLPPRERIWRLLDPGSPFLELSQLAAFDMYGGTTHGAGLIAGVGRIEGRECMIVANDATVHGGAYYPVTVKKHLRAQEIAGENRLPCLYLIDSGGANLPRQTEVFPDREHFGRILYNQARLSAAGVPQIAVVMEMEPGAAGEVHAPAMADETIVVGGRRPVGHGEFGVADRLARNDAHALEIARSVVASLNTRKRIDIPMERPRPPTYPAAELLGVVPEKPGARYDIREVIARLADGSEFDEFKAQYGAALVAGFAHIEGIPVGVLANNGILHSESALKAARFVELCCQRRIPLLFLQNTSGFIADFMAQRHEAGEMVEGGARMVAAVACATVPKVTVIIGRSYGAANYAMCGRSFGPRFLFCWPNARISVMGGEQATSALAAIRRAKVEADGGSWSAEEEEAFKAPIRARYEAEGSPYHATARLWDDGIITPLETRRVLALAFSATLNAPIPETRFGSSGLSTSC